MQFISNDTLDKAVLLNLKRHVGRDNAIERWILVEQITGRSVPMLLRNDANQDDRDVRESVSRLREQGYLICDVGDGDGRFMANTADEFWRFYSYYVKPIKRRAKIAMAMRKAAAVQFPNLLQPALFGMDDADFGMLEKMEAR